MGKLSLNSKLFNNIIFKPFESKNIVFEGPSGTTMGNFINTFDIFNVDGNGVINMYIGNLNTSPLITFISDGSDWLNLITEENVSNYVIPLNAIFQINSTSNVLALLNLGGNATNYFQGQTSIKKQNLTSLFDYNANPPNNIYTFKSGTVNTISTVFNIQDFTGGGTFNTADKLYINNVLYYRKTGLGAGWRTSSGADATNVVINPDSTIYILYINSVDNTPRSVNPGAIIQKLNSGKLNLN